MIDKEIQKNVAVLANLSIYISQEDAFDPVKIINKIKKVNEINNFKRIGIIDSEDEGELYIGCAGGIDITATLEYKEETPAADLVARRITLKGLRGGHSGLEINQGRGNAINTLIILS